MRTLPTTGYFHEKFIMAENKSRYNVFQLGIWPNIERFAPFAKEISTESELHRNLWEKSK